MADEDRVRIRELKHAWSRGESVHKADPQAEVVLARGRDAATALNQQVSAVLAEAADDPPVRARRVRAATGLRNGTVAAIQRFRAAIALRATDPETGEVIDQPLLDQADALARTYLPEGNLGGLPTEGPALQLHAGLVRDALAGHAEGSALAKRLGALLEEHGSAMEHVATEASELSVVRDGLETARVHADRMRRAGWHFLQYLSNATDIPIDLKSIYPVSGRARTDDPQTANAALDEAGAPEVEPVESNGALPPEAG